MSGCKAIVICTVVFFMTGIFCFADQKKDMQNKKPEKTITNKFGMKFVYIGPGSFIMGSPEGELGGLADEDQRKVTMKNGYYMQTTEMTQEQCKAVTGVNPSFFTNCGKDCPVENVSWEDVQVFLKIINKQGDGVYRLPTEAEWEYACRAGSVTAFANGDITNAHCGNEPNLDAMGWFCGNSDNKIHRVALKKPNAWGLFDMHGNVNEWCQDWHDDFPAEYDYEKSQPPEAFFVSFRGGSAVSKAFGCRSAIRQKNKSYVRDFFIGFRLVRVP